MTTLQNGIHELAAQPSSRPHRKPHPLNRVDAELLRRCAWEVGEHRSADAFHPTDSHVALGMVTPYEGFAHWNVRTDWVDEAARQKGDRWQHCRLILRLYDVSYIEFNGLNAHQIHDHPLPGLVGQRFFKLSRPGTWQLGEVGFLLRCGEFIPAARSRPVPFPPTSSSSRGSQTALLLDPRGGLQEIGNIWDQERVLHERRQPKLRHPLRLATFAFGARATGDDSSAARFVTELAAGQCAAGHEVHVFLPESETFRTPQQTDGVHYHPLPVNRDGSPMEQARSFAQVAERCLRELPPFDLLHLHDWLTGSVAAREGCPTVLSLSSVEATRRNGSPAGPLSLEIEDAERQVARAASCVLTPHWLRDRAAADLGVDDSRVVAFPMEGRMPNEWECFLDVGQVKKDVGFGPLDRMLLYVGPLEHAAGVDLLIEALPVLLQRAGNLRVAIAGSGNLYGSLQHRAHQLGVAWAVRLLGDVESGLLTRVLRASEALVLPSRYRVPFDDAVVDLARRAGRPVVTTHAGPAHLVRHEENGLITYDNPGSMVWAIDRVLGDPGHADRMGRNGRRSEEASVVWSDVARHYLELCAARFPELSQTNW